MADIVTKISSSTGVFARRVSARLVLCARSCTRVFLRYRNKRDVNCSDRKSTFDVSRWNKQDGRRRKKLAEASVAINREMSSPLDRISMIYRNKISRRIKSFRDMRRESICFSIPLWCESLQHTEQFQALSMCILSR